MMRKIDVEAYLDYSLKMKAEEMETRDSVNGWLPDKIIDCHSHCNLSEHVLNISDRLMKQMITTFPYFSLEESTKIKEILYPGKKVYSLRFTNPIAGIDHKKANEYLVSRSKHPDKAALYGLPDNIRYTVEMLRTGKFFALKRCIGFIEKRPLKRFMIFSNQLYSMKRKG